jgi:hypothetical protein
MASKLKKFTLLAVTQFFKHQIEYGFDINAVQAAQLAAVAGNVDQQSDFIIQATLKYCIDNDLLRVFCKFELKVICGSCHERAVG